MRKDTREAVGLGSPPSEFSTNPSESIFAALKRKVDYKQSEWAQFNEQMKQYMESQREEIMRALSGRGQYRLCPQFAHHEVPTQLWMKMRPDQRQEVVQNFRKASLPVACRQGHHPASTDSAGRTCPVTVTENPVVCGAGPSQPTLEVVGPLSRHLSIAAEDSGITLIPLVTLSVMWAKAEKLLQMKNAVTPAPGSNLRAKMVISYSHATPHYVQCKSDGQYNV